MFFGWAANTYSAKSGLIVTVVNDVNVLNEPYLTLKAFSLRFGTDPFLCCCRCRCCHCGYVCVCVIIMFGLLHSFATAILTLCSHRLRCRIRFDSMLFQSTSINDICVFCIVSEMKHEHESHKTDVYLRNMQCVDPPPMGKMCVRLRSCHPDWQQSL